MTPEQRQKLKDYAAQKDRRPEPVFAGRRDLFKVVEENVHMVSTDGKSTGSTVCITGPAGVGKSAFANALKKRKKLGDYTVHCVEIDKSSLHHPGCVLAAFANQIEDFTFGAPFYERLSGFGVGVSAVGAGGNISFSWEPRSKPPFTTFPEDLFREGAKKLLAKGHAFILIVDEAQRLKPTPGGPANDLLSNLHHQPVNAPIVPVLLGQPGTQQEIKDTISASRYSDGNEPFMVGLDEEDRRKYVEKMFGWLEIEGTPEQREALGQWILAECGGWPHHLSNCMKAIAKELYEAESMNIGDMNTDSLQKELRERRIRYYRSRINSQGPVEVAQKAALKVIRKCPVANLYENAAQALEKYPPREPVLPSELKNALLMSGLVARFGIDQHICPIPSMAQYLERMSFTAASELPDLHAHGDAAAEHGE